MKKIIKYYRKSNYGRPVEYVHPDNAADGAILFQLTGQKTIDSRIRELVRDLTGGTVDFVEVLPI